MRDKVARLHELRQELMSAKTEIEDRQVQWQQDNKVILDKCDDLVKRVKDAEDEIRRERLDIWDGEDKSKQYGIGIREMTQLKYNEEDA